MGYHVSNRELTSCVASSCVMKTRSSNYTLVSQGAKTKKYAMPQRTVLVTPVAVKSLKIEPRNKVTVLSRKGPRFWHFSTQQLHRFRLGEIHDSTAPSDFSPRFPSCGYTRAVCAKHLRHDHRRYYRQHGSRPAERRSRGSRVWQRLSLYVPIERL